MCALYVRCALSVLQKECRKVWGARYTLGARYRSENTVNRLRWFGHVQRMEENRIPKKVLYMNLRAARLRGRPRNRWQDGVRKDGRIVGGEGWQEEVHNREEWKKPLRTARNRHILHMPMELMKYNSICSI